MEQETPLKKDVIITIASSQDFEGCEPDHINLITAGRLYRRGGKYFVSYEESELTGMEGTRTTLKLEDQQVTMTRTGTHPTQMLFAKNKRHVGLYQTDVGSMVISTHTSHLVNTIGENGGSLAIDYTVEIDSTLAGTHRFEMAVTPSNDAPHLS
ncbi:MAG: DUF1934 domain-containing protein [Butyricicoccus porcorum]|nr:DUF1934 domain-containing protein [Butyricicoccus porcorum]